MSRAKEFLEYFNNPSKQKVTFHFANDESRKALNTLLATIERLGGWGSSRRLIHDVGGDGGYRVRMRGLDKVDIPNTEPSEVEVPGHD